ncbi:MAG: hypothetical protein CMN28_08815 [Salinisphaeraceae bacterium]|nr:hypothetical protein [Salinisphaeraceae bacterium]
MPSSHPPIRHPGQVSGHASFLHRDSSLRERCLMQVGDTLAVGFGLLLRLGGAPLKRAIIAGLGALAYRVVPEKRRVARTNLDLVFGDRLSDAEKSRIVSVMFRHFARGLLDLFYDRIYWPNERVAASVNSDAKAKLDELQDIGRGSAVVSCHLGNPEMLLRLLTEAGYDGYALYKGLHSPWFDRYVGRKRLAAGAGLIEVPSSRHRSVDGKRQKLPARSIRSEIEALWANNSGIGFVADQHTRTGMKINVLGVPDTPTQIGAWRYVVENRIPFLLHVAVYDETGGLTWHCSDIFRVTDQGSPDETLAHYLQQANYWFEEMVRRYPEQYFWGHRRFDRRHYE